MGMRFGPGPVFAAECLTASRRVQFYSARVLLVLGLLAGLAVVWLGSDLSSSRHVTVQELASIGSRFFTALMGVELCLALMVAPAAAAGAICQDRTKGGLALMMTTDLTDSEIVLGRLVSRLMSTLGVIACSLPVLALATLLGGVDPVAVAGGTVVIVGVAAISVGMALTFSLWAGKPHEALSATYVVWAVWLLALLAWDATLGGPLPEFLVWSNPFSLIFSTAGNSIGRLPGQFLFCAACLAGTAALAAISTRMLRHVTLRREGRPARRRVATRHPAPGWLRWIGQGSPALDDDPILWREWHRKRPSPFTRAIWWTYALIGILFTVVGPFSRRLTPGVAAFQVSIGLLLACVGAATCLAEERAQGGLDVVLATPLDSRKIVLGKWRGAFRIVPRLAILPGLLVFATGVLHGGPGSGTSFVDALIIAALVVLLTLVYGAVVTGLGLVIAIFQPRQGWAVALTVASYLGVTVAYPAIMIPLLRVGPAESLPYWPSPFLAILFTAVEAENPRLSSPLDLSPLGVCGFVAMVALVAFVLLRVALASFDRRLGRVVDRSKSVDREPRVLMEVDFIAEPRA
jgi:ABC-type transport system involved in multi-copper enzyme maturation permease subunit